MTKQSSVLFEGQYDVNLGEINITTNVLESIAAKAASEVDGVFKLHARLQNEIGGFFTRDRDRLGAKVTREANDIAIDVEISINYGSSVPEVALKVQERVKEQILFMTDLVVQEVNVHVISIETEPAKEQDYLHLEEEFDIENGEAFE